MSCIVIGRALLLSARVLAPQLVADKRACNSALAALTPARRTVLQMVVRTKKIDDELRAFLKACRAREGTTASGQQVLILGAGLDARALRLSDDLGQDTETFEVDAPASQSSKRKALLGAATALPAPLAGAARAAAEGSAPGKQGGEQRVHYAPCDFEKEGALKSMAESLAREGFDRSRPTFTIWEARLLSSFPVLT